MIHYEYKPPIWHNNTVELYPTFKIFVGGSIEQNTAEHWQSKFIKTLSDEVKSVLCKTYHINTELLESSDKKCISFFNPRRDDWDSSWDCDKNNREFYEQVTWELDHLDKSDLIAIYFDPNTKSPISLLELGLYATSGKVFVCCPKGFWRKGNVDIVCEKYNIPIFEDFDTWVYSMAKHALKSKVAL